MAIYQYKAFLLPNSCLTALSGESDRRFDMPGLVERCWAANQPPEDYRQCLESVLPKGESWTEALAVWGDTKGNHVDVFLHEGRVTDLYFRVDARHLEQSFLDLVVDFARHCGCAIVQSDGAVVEPRAEALRSAVEGSRAYLYCTDREEYLRILDKNDTGE